MAASRAMRRLLHVRELEEEQRRVAVESALGGLRLLQRELAGAQQRERRGRRLVTASAATGDLVDRVAGLEETGTARRQAAVLAMRIQEAEQNVVLLRQEFVAKRVERRQVKVIIQTAADEEAM